MALPRNPPDDVLVRYLLGALPPGDEEALDELSIVDGTMAERLRAIEDDLADAYVRGELSPDDRARWEGVYKASRPGRERLQLARALAALESRQARLRDRGRFSWAVAAAAMVAIGTAIAYVSVRDRSSSRQAAPVSRQQPSTAQTPTGPTAPRVVALTLAPATRALATAPVLSIPAGTTEARLTLQLEPDSYARYNVEVRDAASNRVVFNADRMDAIALQDGRALKVAVPVSVLQSARYLIHAYGVGSAAPDIVASYPIIVVLQ